MYYKMKFNSIFLITTILLFILLSTGIANAGHLGEDPVNLKDNSTYEIGEQIKYEYENNILDARLISFNNTESSNINSSLYINKTNRTMRIFTSELTDGKYKLHYNNSISSNKSINFSLINNSLDVEISQNRVVNNQDSRTRFIIKRENFDLGSYSITSSNLNDSQLSNIFGVENQRIKNNEVRFDYDNRNIIQASFNNIPTGEYEFKIRDIQTGLTEKSKIEVIDNTDGSIKIQDVDKNITSFEDLNFTIDSKNVDRANFVITNNLGYKIDFNLLNLNKSDKNTVIDLNVRNLKLNINGSESPYINNSSKPQTHINYRTTSRNLVGDYQILIQNDGITKSKSNFSIVNNSVTGIEILSKSNNTYASSVEQLKNESKKTKNISEYDRVIFKIKTNYVNSRFNNIYKPYKINNTTKIDPYSELYINLINSNGTENILSTNQSRVYLHSEQKEFFVVTNFNNLSNLEPDENYTVEAFVKNDSRKTVKQNFSTSKRYIDFGTSNSNKTLKLNQSNLSVTGKTNIIDGTTVNITAEKENLDEVEYTKEVNNGQLTINLSKLDLQPKDNFTIYVNYRKNTDGYIQPSNETNKSDTQNKVSKERSGIIYRIISFLRSLV